MLDLGSKWFMHGRFWLNNPDALIVGDADETLGEAIGRATLLALTGGVVFLADRLPELEAQPQRLRLVSRCLPSSNQAARPLDLFRLGAAGRDYPRAWHLHADAGWGQWEALGLFNWSPQPLQDIVRLDDLGLAPGREFLVHDFWTDTTVGRFSDDFPVVVPAGTARCLRLMAVPDHPMVAATDMHVTQGLVDLADVAWDPERLALRGTGVRAPDETGAVFVYVPPGFRTDDPQPSEAVARVDLRFVQTREPWELRFRRADGVRALPLNPSQSILLDPMSGWQDR